MAFAKVTRERLESSDYYRLQVDVDKPLMAFGYNPLSGFSRRADMEVIRNAAARAAGDAIRSHIVLKWRSSPAYRDYWERYIAQYVEEELHREAHNHMGIWLLAPVTTNKMAL